MRAAEFELGILAKPQTTGMLTYLDNLSGLGNRSEEHTSELRHTDISRMPSSA